MNRTIRLIGAGAVACASLFALPAAGHAASLTIIGDAGAPVPLTPGLAIRNFDTSVTPAFSAAESADTYRYSMSVTNAAGASALSSTPSCLLTTGGNRSITYTGNGIYTATISTWGPMSNGRANNSCTGAPTETYTAQFSINASSGIIPPAQGARLLTRNPGQFTSNKYQFPVDINPGASLIEVTYAPGAVLTNGTGPIQGQPRTTYQDPGTNLASVSFSEPGNYTFLARAQRGSSFSPYSAPLAIRVQDPFDFSARVSFVDSRGPRYSMRGIVFSEALRGKKVTMYLKKRGAKKWRRVSSGKVRSNRRVAFKFTQKTNGRYSAQFRFKGSALVRSGSVTYAGLRFYTRRIFR